MKKIFITIIFGVTLSVLALALAGTYAFADNKMTAKYMAQGDKLVALEKYAEAFKFYDKAISVDSKYADVYVKKGIAYKDLRDFTKAMASFDKALSLNPKSANAYNGKAMVDNYLGKPEEAIKLCDKAIKINPKFYDAYSNKGISYLELQKFDDAYKYFLQCVSINPKYADGYSNVAFVLDIYYMDYKKSIKYYTLAEGCARSIREKFTCYRGKGDVYLKMQKFQEALTYYNKTLDTKSMLIKSSAEGFYKDLGLIQVLHANKTKSNEMFQAAIESVNISLKVNDNNAEDFIIRSGAYASLNMKDKAIEDLKKALKIDEAYVGEAHQFYNWGLYNNIKDMEEFNKLGIK